MKHNVVDWSVLRTSIIVLVISLAFSAVLLTGSFYFQKTMQAEYDRNQSRFLSISNRYLAVDEEERLIRNYYPEFVELHNRGIFGREHRLDWIETLRASGEIIDIPSLRYEISSQTEYQQDLPVNMGRFRLYSSTMRISMDMLHEGDLLRLLETLNRMQSGIYSVSDCSFTQRGSIDVEDIRRGNITSSCNLHWFNIKMPDGSDISAS
jgi:hypothetical protein